MRDQLLRFLCANYNGLGVELSEFLKEYPDYDNPVWVQARKALAASNETVIAHVDAGLFAHPALGYDAAGTPPANILISQERNYYDSGKNGHDDTPVSQLRKSGGFINKIIDHPDHGTKTTSIILGADPAHFAGAAPGATILPYRVSNGPMFRNNAEKRMGANHSIGRAIEHAIRGVTRADVISLSMGNPGHQGLFAFLFRLAGASFGVTKNTRDAIDRAYNAGVIICAAGGQVAADVVYPAKFRRTIAVAGYSDEFSHRQHFPQGGYTTGDGFVDTWALAAGLNRASGTRGAGGIPIAKYASSDTEDKVKGTSYATAFVAAGAALWLEKYRSDFNAPEFSLPANRWRKVEAFRNVLKSMPSERVESGRADRPNMKIRPLDMVRLLQTPPELPPETSKKPRSQALML